ncbi:MAG: GatB/YqeY domain-containing protein [Ignavibacteria bacterium]|nr:GatB/YqeY domain-containing protein [Ignavibacteria bacterium]
MLKDRISEDLKRAMKAGDKIRVETLRTLRAALIEKEIEKRGSGSGMDPEDELGVLATAVKKRRESIEHFEKAGRAELVAQEGSEIEIIQEYLPEQLSETEVLAVIEEIVSSTGADTIADFGKVMPLVMKQLKGKADGRRIQELVRSRLGA